jgi:hypothetical protein
MSEFDFVVTVVVSYIVTVCNEPLVWVNHGWSEGMKCLGMNHIEPTLHQVVLTGILISANLGLTLSVVAEIFHFLFYSTR